MKWKTSHISLWVSKIFVNAARNIDVSVSSGGDFGVKNVDKSFYDTCRDAWVHIASHSVRVEQWDEIANKLTEYDYVLNGQDLDRPSVGHVYYFLAEACNMLNKKVPGKYTWTLENTTASNYEIPIFLKSDFGQILTEEGLISDDLINAASAKDTSGDTETVSDGADVDMLAAAEDGAEDDSDQDASEQPVAAAQPEPAVTADNVKDNDEEEASTGETNTSTDNQEQSVEVQPEQHSAEDAVPAAADIQSEAQPGEPKRKRRTTRKKRNSVLIDPKTGKTIDPYYGNISDTVKRSRDEYLKDENGNYVLDKYGNKIKKKRARSDKNLHPKMSNYVRNLIGTPQSPIPMTGENGVLYIIKGKGNSTSSKTPKAFIMPLTHDKTKDYAQTGNVAPSSQKTLDSRQRVNSNGQLKVKIAGASSLQNQTIFFNTRAEAEEVLKKIFDADQADAADLKSQRKPDAFIQGSMRVAKGVNKEDLVCTPIQLLTKDPNWGSNLTVFGRGFYQVDTEFGPQWISAFNLLESLSANGDLILEEVDDVDAPAEDKFDAEEYNKNWRVYDEAFSHELD